MNTEKAIEDPFQWNRCGFRNGFINFAIRIYFDVGADVWKNTFGKTNDKIKPKDTESPKIYSSIESNRENISSCVCNVM